jgi:hypothetical protein
MPVSPIHHRGRRKSKCLVFLHFSTTSDRRSRRVYSILRHGTPHFPVFEASAHTERTRQATFTKLKSGSWRAQIRRKGQCLHRGVQPPLPQRAPEHVLVPDGCGCSWKDGGSDPIRQRGSTVRDHRQRAADPAAKIPAGHPAHRRDRRPEPYPQASGKWSRLRSAPFDLYPVASISSASKSLGRVRGYFFPYISIYSSILKRRLNPIPTSSRMNSMPFTANNDRNFPLVRNEMLRTLFSNSRIVLSPTCDFRLSSLALQPSIARATRHCSWFIVWASDASR